MKLSHKHMYIVPFVIFIAGLSFGTMLTVRNVFKIDSAQASFLQPVQIATELSQRDKISGKPSRILIPALKINNQIENGVYDSTSHTWNLSNTNAHHAETSAPANATGGNTFIYGHNSRKIFGRLSALPIGGQTVLETTNGLKFYYQLESISEVQPSDVAVLDYAGPPILTIQTCSGNWNEKRQMFRFKLLHVEITTNSSSS